MKLYFLFFHFFFTVMEFYLDIHASMLYQHVGMIVLVCLCMSTCVSHLN